MKQSIINNYFKDAVKFDLGIDFNVFSVALIYGDSLESVSNSRINYLQYKYYSALENPIMWTDSLDSGSLKRFNHWVIHQWCKNIARGIVNQHKDRKGDLNEFEAMDYQIATDIVNGTPKLTLAGMEQYIEDSGALSIYLNS